MKNPNTTKAVRSAVLKRRIATRSLGLLFVALLWPLTSVRAAVYSFSLFGPMTATNANGSTIRVTGSGRFDTEGAVDGHGSYSIRNNAGEVIERGTWSATEFVSFESDGGPNNGLQGGDLVITVTLYPNDGPPEAGVPLTLVCPFENGVFDVPSCDITIADFINPIGGIMAFHLIEP